MPKFATVLYFSIGLQQVSLEFRNTHLVGILRKFHLEFHQTWNKKNLWFARGHKIWCWSQKMGNTTVCKTHWLFVAISSWHIQLNIQRYNLIVCRPFEKIKIYIKTIFYPKMKWVRSFHKSLKYLMAIYNSYTNYHTLEMKAENRTTQNSELWGTWWLSVLRHWYLKFK